MVLAVAFGYFSPAHGVAMKPLGDAFIRLITMIITVLIFCTVVTGIAGMQDLKKVGRVGGRLCSTLKLFSTIALVVGLIVWQRSSSRQRIQCKCGLARCQGRCRLCRAGQGAERPRISHAHHPHHGDGCVREGRHSAGGIYLDSVWLWIVFGGPRAKPIIAILESLTHVVFRVVIF